MNRTAAQDPAISQVFKTPFAHQAAFFRGKLGKLLPSETWEDVQQTQHDTGFMVSGAQCADLLADLAAAVDRLVVEGKGIDEFRKDWDAIVERHGWQYRGKRDWRTRTVYTTNVSTSYAGGRLAQLREGEFPWWMYKHSDLALVPRPLHLAWDGMVLAADSPWWLTNYPPNGWGCHCRVTGVRDKAQAERLGGRIVDQAPDNSPDPVTGVPAGVDKGWDYMPGDSVSDIVSQMAQKTTQWEYTLAKAYMQGVPEGTRDALATAYRGLPSVADDTRRYADRVIEKRESLDIQPYQTLGLLTTDDAALVERLTGMSVKNFDFALDKSAIGHINKKHGDPVREAMRGQTAVTSADYALLPEILNGPDNVEDAGLSDVGQPVVRYKKRIRGKQYTAAFEVRKGRKMMVLQSMWVKDV